MCCLTLQGTTRRKLMLKLMRESQQEPMTSQGNFLKDGGEEM
jgi:hypothetical protein